MIEITSYGSVGGVSFGTEESSVSAILGAPVKRGTNREKETEFYFSGFTLRFDADARGLRECTLLPECVATINGFPIDWSHGFLGWLFSKDGDLKEVHGFVVSLKLGVAVTGVHGHDESQKAIHAFRYGDWDIFRSEMRSFRDEWLL